MLLVGVRNVGKQSVDNLASLDSMDSYVEVATLATRRAQDENKSYLKF